MVGAAVFFLALSFLLLWNSTDAVRASHPWWALVLFVGGAVSLVVAGYLFAESSFNRWSRRRG